MNKKGGIFTETIVWIVGFIFLMFVIPIFFEIVFASPPTGIERFLILASPWVLLLVYVARLLRILTSGGEVL